MVIRLSLHGAGGVMVPRTTPRNLSIGMIPHTTLAKLDIQPIVNLCNDM
jgi:hypothetical protein